MTIKVFVSCLWWQVPGVGNTRIHCEMSSYLLNMCIHVRSKLIGQLRLESLSLLPITGARLESWFHQCFGWWDGESGRWAVAAQRVQTSLLALSGYIGGNFFWNWMKWSEVWWRSERMDRNHSSLSVSVLFVPPGFSLVLTQHCSSIETLKCQVATVLFTLMWTDWQRGGTVYMKRPAVIGFGLTCPTSQSGNQPASAQTPCCYLLKQFFTKKKP